MQPTSPPLAGRLRAPGYVLLGLMGVLPVLDFLIVAWPMKPSEVTWRFGAFGQLSASAAAPLVALLLLYALAYACADRKMLRFCAAITIVYALLLITATLSFPLDALEMRRRVPTASQTKFGLASGDAVIRLALYSIGALVLAASQWRSARLLARIEAKAPDASSVLLMRKASLSGATRPSAATSRADEPTSDVASPEE
jgi:hypothetical protein